MRFSPATNRAQSGCLCEALLKDPVLDWFSFRFFGFPVCPDKGSNARGAKWNPVTRGQFHRGGKCYTRTIVRRNGIQLRFSFFNNGKVAGDPSENMSHGLLPVLAGPSFFEVGKSTLIRWSFRDFWHRIQSNDSLNDFSFSPWPFSPPRCLVTRREYVRDCQ